MVRETLIETAREQNIPVLDGYTLEETLKMLADSGRAYDVMYVTLQKLDKLERSKRQEEKDEKFLERYCLGAAPLKSFYETLTTEQAKAMVEAWQASNAFMSDFLIEMKALAIEAQDIKTTEEPHKDSSYLDKLGGSLVGQKVKGIRFPNDNKHVNWVYDMEKYIGQKGIITAEHDHSVVVFFDDISFWYPKEEILKSFY